jgi:predicted NAD/FAD-dependent oxidoreductase
VSQQVEIAIIGAGITGLTCARILQQAGYQVVVLEKSRGVGGRMATRRLQGTIADHGTCYLSPKGEAFRHFIQDLVTAGIVEVWTDAIYTLDANGQLHAPAASDRAPRYVAPAGMTAIAKFLAAGLEIRFNQRVINLASKSNQHWQLTLENTSSEATAESILEAQAVIVTTPAPQAVTLLQPLVDQEISEASLNALNAVEFLPCISVMAGYPAEREADWLNQYPDVKAIASSQHPDLAWVGLDSSKRPSASHLLLVIQSTAAFARQVLEETDLMSIGHRLLQQTASLAPWIPSPDWLQVHRWRYAFTNQPLQQPYWIAGTPAPLVCSGDWCSGRRVENAFQAGWETAYYLNSHLQNYALKKPSRL